MPEIVCMSMCKFSACRNIAKLFAMASIEYPILCAKIACYPHVSHSPAKFCNSGPK